MTLPVALSGNDVIGQAKTGTGKTLGFGLPLLERVTVPADVEAGRAKPEQLTDAPQALVVVPTRELCTQVTNDLLTAGKVRNVRVLAIYGGRAYEPQVEALKKGVDVIVGTPGRLLDLAGQKKLDLKHIKALVLDEADEMLDLGFLPDVEKIINMLPARRQTMLFSATMPGAVIGLARRYMSQPTHISATSPDDAGQTVRNTAQFIYRAHNMDKPEMVARILQADGRGLAMVFCRTKRTAADLADQLQQRGFASGAVHGDLGQGAREQALRAFRNGKVDVLVCTDVAARGIDVEGVTHVINYQSPEDEKTYLHRIGRTGRAGAKGIAITLVDWDDIPRWQLINKALDLGFNNPPETYSTSPHLFEELSIPAGTKGVLPRAERTRAGLGAEEVEDLGETGGRGARGRGDRGGRGGQDSRGGRGDRGGRDESRSADSERAARTPRRRRRTRSGTPMDATAPSAGAELSVPATNEPAVESAVTPVSSEDTAPRAPRRRRRTRGGAQGEVLPTAAGVEAVVPEAPQAPEAAAQTAVTTAEGTVAVDAQEAPAKTRRRRTRKPAEAAVTPSEPAATPVTVEPVAEAVQVSEAPAVSEPEAPATAPRRRTRKATATATTSAAAETAVDAAEGTTEAAPETAEAKPRRRTRKAVAAPAEAEAAVDTVEATKATPRRRTRKAAEPAPVADVTAGIPAQTTQEPEPAAAGPRRTRKTAAPAEAAVDSAEGAEAKPRRTRKTAAKAEAEVEVKAEAAVDAAEAAQPAPRRRTRKAAVPAVTTESAEPSDTAEAKPRRTRKTAAAAATDAAEGTEAKPRLTHKAAAAKAADDMAEAAEAKPRRARKTAARTAVKAEAAVDTAEGAEAKPKARRTRKATPAAESAAAASAAGIPAQASEEPEVTPRRRTSKATAAPAEASGETAEAKPRVRRARKATAATEPADS
ncbi:DEAD/DEAH box helicase [Streptomyces sp. ALI-76-A]|uniref:DEAD/DEAH box helicase n=1 Tax=Streptomyces sp. ALI-76-A TaxID=3025736 RepID=UPI00256EC474|nr:DEAD/DEAH box helicase [Streptomyces sp. ALI-76-A]MDL5203660.1 DEAD/DEAH box helicase [Streptomyces sp. ALI-76-A]